ncbi:MAG: hypothetical protein ACYTJ0_09170 [Planctomycetota bacterium]|jgi:hypothetical protein
MNDLVGWIMIDAGFVSGLLLSPGILKDGFLGGYGAPRRRLLRLGHIACFALGALNLLFALHAGAAVAEPDLRPAAWGFAVGAVTMPLCCALVAWSRRWFLLFAVPVTCLIGGASVMLWRYLP